MLWQRILTPTLGFLFTINHALAATIPNIPSTPPKYREQQQPLLEQHYLSVDTDGDTHNSLEDSDAFKRLSAALGSRLFKAEPLGKPCYSNPDPLNPRQCQKVMDNLTIDQWISAQEGGYFFANWASCQSLNESCAVPVTTNTSIPVTSTCRQGSVASYMISISPTSPIPDIQAAFRFARDIKSSSNISAPLIIKNTGHDWKGRSSAPGSVALWTHGLRSPTVPIVLNRSFVPLGCPSSQTPEPVFHFGAGETWGGAYHFAEKNNLAILGGTCGTVGIVGWLSGGGHSPLTPVYGMGVDNVRQVEIVTPLGEVKVANECQNQDLFFAVRGGGGGTYGVVTNITYKAVERFPITGFTAKLDPRVLKGDNGRNFFNNLTSHALAWGKNGWGGYLRTDGSGLQFVNSANISEADAKKDMAELASFLKATGQENSFNSWPSWFHYFKDKLEPSTVHVGGWSAAVASRLLPQSLFSSEKRRDGLVNALLNLQNSTLHMWIMLVTPTIFPHTDASALHPSWKDAVWEIRINEQWDQFLDTELPVSHFQKASGAMDELRGLAPGMTASINEADIWEPDFEDTFWGASNAQKLHRVKKEVDPENLLTNWMAIGYNQADARFKCYPQPSQRS